MSRTVLALALAAGLGLGSMAHAQTATPPVAASAPAGTYKLDARHVGLVVRIGHGGGFSKSVFRFNTIDGQLGWDASTPAKIALNVTVDMKSIDSNVPGFAEELNGDRFLKTAQFPTATFVSTGVKQIDATHADVTGDLTFLGVTKPLTIRTELLGAGNNMRAVPTLGFTGTASFKRSDFGFTTLLGPIGDQVDLLIDVEFNKVG